MIHCLLGTVAYFANPKNIIDCKHPITEAGRELFGKLECKLMCYGRKNDICLWFFIASLAGGRSDLELPEIPCAQVHHHHTTRICLR